jgi:putative ABC transport system permease protein
VSADRLYAALLRLLVPAWLRRRVGDEMRATCAERLAAAGSPRERRRELARELAGLVRVAVVARVERPVHLPQERPPVLDGLRQDLAFALRALRRRRAVAALATATLAVGVGASTAMFSVIDGVLLRPLPFERPEQIVLATPTIEEWKSNPSLRGSWQDGRFSPPELRAWLATQRSFEAAGGYTSGSARVPNGAGSELIPVARATAGLWAALRVRPLLGRLPTDDERDSVAVVSHAYWRAHLGGDSGAVGRDLRLDDRPVRVIGVLPLTFALVGMDADVWRPLALPPGDEDLGIRHMRAVGRQRDGTTLARAGQEMTRVLRGADAAEPRHLTHGAYLVSPVALATRDLRTFGVAALLAAATGVLVGCFPALSLSRVDAAESLRSRVAASRTGRLQRGVVVAELALATVLLVGTGLLTRTMRELQRVRPGFAADGLFTVQLNLPWDLLYPPGVDRTAADAGAAALLALSLAAAVAPARRAGNVDPASTLRADS